MSATGLKVFDTTLHKTSIWLDGIMEDMGWEDKHRAYEALRSVLHTLRDRLLPNEAVHLGAQLPMLVRGFYYEGWHPAATPFNYRHKEEFLRQVAKELPGLGEADLERAVATVFAVLSRHLPDGELRQVKDQLPLEVRQLWH